MTLGFILPLTVYTLVVLLLGVLGAFALRQIDLRHASAVFRRGVQIWGVSLVALMLFGWYIAFSFDGDWRQNPPSTIADFQSEFIY